MDEMSDLERLLAEEGIDLGSVDEERPEGSEGMSARDWMIATSDDELIRKKIGDEPMAEASQAESVSDGDDDAFSGMSDLERLLAEEGIELGTVAEERPKGSEGMSARDYLISTSDDELIRNKVGQEAMSEAPTPKPQAVADDSDDDLPDWLTAEEEESLDDVAFDGGVKTAPVDVDDKMVVEGDLPDWLQDVEEESSISELPSSLGTEDDLMVVENDLPDWLQEEDDSLSGAAEAIAIPEQVGIPSAEDDDLPDWLQDVEDETPSAIDNSFVAEPETAIADDDKMVVDEDLPDWLRDEEDGSATLEAPDPVTAVAPAGNDKMVVDEDLPEWLRDQEEADEVLAATALPEPVDADLATEPAIAGDEDLPDWLTDVEEEAEDTVVLDADTIDEDLPDWLRDVEDVEEAIPEPVGQALVEDEDLPDWLKEVQEEEDDQEAAPAPLVASVLDDASKMPDEQFDDEDLPDWLREVQEEEDVTVPLVTESVTSSDEITTLVADDDLPDWLQEDQVDEADEELFESDFREVVSDELPEWLAGVETGDEEPFEPSEPSPVESGEIVIEDDLPDWLQEEDDFNIADESAVPEPVVVAAEMVKPEDTIVEEDELPDWLAEGTFEEEDTLPEPIEEPEAVEAEDTTPAVPKPVVEEKAAPLVPEPVVQTPTVTQPSGMPNWLQKLRQGGDEAETVSAPVTEIAPVLARVDEPQPVAQVASEVNNDIEALPSDPDERLKMAQIAKENDDIPSAIRIYDSLVSSSTHLDKVIDDVEITLKTHPSNYQLYQVLGDAMMKDGRLQSALEAYRKALEKL